MKQQFVMRLYVKDPDAFGEICEALGEDSRKWFEFSEYAGLRLTCEVQGGRPVIVSAEFESVKP